MRKYESPTAVDWDELRLHDQEIRDQSRSSPHIPPAGAVAADAWSSDLPEADYEAEFDTTGYLHLMWGICRPARQHVIMTLFNAQMVGKGPGPVKLYDIELQPGKERILAYSILTKVGMYGAFNSSAVDTFSIGRQRDYQRKVRPKPSLNHREWLKTVDLTLPHPDEYLLVKEQFERGSLGLFRRAF